MTVETIDRATRKINTARHRDALNVHDLTYLRTYPFIRKVASDSRNSPTTYLAVITLMAYGWMPRALRQFREPGDELEKIVALLGGTRKVQEDVVTRMARCLHSVVGASKALHFAQPTVYPIWDSTVAEALYGKKGIVTGVSAYLAYVDDVHDFISSPEAKLSIKRYKVAYQSRLRHLEIPSYVIGSVRAVESAVFEYARGT